ncbi:outer membrane beta-barrel protein [Thalassotalea hakodatensis]|uniref:outer membrane beta-barrel protein n=1 Tax=Thalassotalea hakodatensis TaxID=3030492 RepID=UPI002572A616|nr:outer membrane beta-barrel protein [Thalassotalea hakodatensis]
MITKQQAFFLGSFLLSAFCSMAQQTSDLPQGNQFNLSLSSEFGTVDNFLFDNSDEQRTNYWSLSPELYLQFVTDKQLFSFDAKTQLNKFSDFEQDDHSNIWLAPRYLYRLTDNKTLSIKASHQQTYEYRGTGLSLGDAQSLNKGDEKQQSSFSLGYSYGSSYSTAQLAVELGAVQSKYQTRRHVTNQLDQDKLFANATFDYQLAGGTFLSSALEIQQIAFEHQPIYDNTKLTALIGMKWPKSVVSQFSLLLGYQKIRFEQPLFDDDSAFKWRISWRWSPAESTNVTLASERDFAAANRLNDSYRLVDKHVMKFTQQLSDYFLLSANVGVNQEEVVYPDKRKSENYLRAGISVDYLMSDRVSLILNYQLSDLNADDMLFEYQRNSVSLGIKITI